MRHKVSSAARNRETHLTQKQEREKYGATKIICQLGIPDLNVLRKQKQLKSHAPLPRYMTNHFLAFQKYVKDLRPMKGSKILAIGTCPNLARKSAGDKVNGPFILLDYTTGVWHCFKHTKTGKLITLSPHVLLRNIKVPSERIGHERYKA